MLEKVSKEIAINQVEVSTFIFDLEYLVANANTFFSKLCNDIPSYSKAIMEKMDNIDIDLWKGSKELSMDPSSNLVYC